MNRNCGCNQQMNGLMGLNAFGAEAVAPEATGRTPGTFTRMMKDPKVLVGLAVVGFIFRKRIKRVFKRSGRSKRNIKPFYTFKR